MKAVQLFRFGYLLLLVLSCTPVNLHAQKNRSEHEIIPATKINLEKELGVFNDGKDSAEYFITLCADIPNNKNPMKVQHEGEPGHVFLILQKINFSSDTISKVFGFYPKGGGLPTIFTRNVRSSIRDNSKRKYDASVSLELSRQEFELVIRKSVELSKYRYKLNKFNCYDYALKVFNSVAGIDTVPMHYVKFPFIFGSGGSPCSLYMDLVWLKEKNPNLSPFIRFSPQLAPVSSSGIAIAHKDSSGKSVCIEAGGTQDPQNQ